MLATVITIGLTYLLTKLNCEISLILKLAMKPILILALILTVLFWIIHVTIAPNKDPDKYGEVWDESSINLIRLVYIFITTVLMLMMISNVHEQIHLLNGTAFFFVTLTVLDIANVLIFYYTYSYNIKECIIDAILFDIQKVRSSLLLVLLVSVTLQETILGIIIWIIVIGVLIGIFRI